ncbi:glutamate 5-kinase [Sphingomonas vulcanisoli]|uniref:Glutamate 5-kinase n=1 Tax=Sphingomonas vulcanisoli TaxID=1658060 RepID=A0ABX0TYL9_9SPHN|nr:glutamate 5-kinase [Sphingomonas vulcanisoli]NIJ09500.1 glutamate 5-kinase [Sphingomonas vulcanisoli]
MTIAAYFSPANAKRLIVKIGSALLVDAKGAIRRDWLAGVVADIAARARAGQQVAIVSSGAIALGARRLGLPKGGRASLEDAQAAAATGQIGLSHAWAELLGAQGLTAAQILVTLDDLEDRRRYLNAAATLDRLLALGVVPIINENDSVATEEIRFGDNDRLAARIGQAARADGVILLSDVDGLYTANPSVDPNATLIPEIRSIDARIMAMADGGSASGMGSGGMISKLQAAKIAVGSGIHLAIVSGKRDDPLAAFEADGRGTLFLGGDRKSAGGGARKAWIAGRLTARGRIKVDAGAAEALRAGRSLLAAGATEVTGTFARGDVVEIIDGAGAVLARGLAEYDAADAARIAGHRSAAHAELLGYAPRSALVHRDHLVLA